MPEKEQISRFLEVESSAGGAFHYIADVIAAVIKLTVYGYFVAVVILSESNDFGYFRQSAHNAVAVYVAQAPFYVIFFV